MDTDNTKESLSVQWPTTAASENKLALSAALQLVTVLWAKLSRRLMMKGNK
jgi:hypothetical protein